MWWFEAILDRIRSLRPGLLLSLAALALAGMVVAGCGGGLRPLHGPTASGADLSERLAAINIGRIPGRVGQQIRNELIFQTTGGGGQSEPEFSLNIVIREAVASTLVQRSGESLSQVYNLDASFVLIDLETDKPVLKGKSYGRAGFERFVSIYANVRARRDAEDRAARTVAQEIKGRLAVFLASKDV